MPSPATIAVHAGESPDLRSGALNTPIMQSSTFLYPELADGSASDYIYTRYDNPTLQWVEQKLAALEGSHGSLVFGSGMAAISAVCQAFLSPGDVVAVQPGIYGGTTAFFEDELRKQGINVVTVDVQDGSPVLPDEVGVVWMESITNPLLRVHDVSAWAEAAHGAGARLVVDGTFATPLLQRPLELGADVVVHSASKYLGGHSDLIGGVLSFGEEFADSLWQRRRNLGGVMDPQAAYLLGRGLKTLPLRMERHCDNAMALARRLEEVGGDLEAVHYPGLPGHPDHATAKEVLGGGFGGMLSLDVGSLARAKSFRRSVRTIVPAASLGGVESLVSLPLETSHAYASAAARRREGITDGLVRISVGIEDEKDLLDDIQLGLDS